MYGLDWFCFKILNSARVWGIYQIKGSIVGKREIATLHAFFKRYSYYTISIAFKVTYFSSKPNIYFLEERVCLLKLHLKNNINMLQTKLLSHYLRLQPVITTFIYKINWHNESLCLFMYTLPFDHAVIYFYMEECLIKLY